MIHHHELSARVTSYGIAQTKLSENFVRLPWGYARRDARYIFASGGVSQIRKSTCFSRVKPAIRLKNCRIQRVGVTSISFILCTKKSSIPKPRPTSLWLTHQIPCHVVPVMNVNYLHQLWLVLDYCYRIPPVHFPRVKQGTSIQGYLYLLSRSRVCENYFPLKKSRKTVLTILYGVCVCACLYDRNEFVIDSIRRECLKFKRPLDRVRRTLSSFLRSR